MIDVMPLDEWIQFDAATPAPTFFARCAWTLALCDDSQRLEPAPLRVRLNGRTYIVPSVRSSARFGMRDFIAFPLGAYTCVLDERGATVDALAASRVFAEIARFSDRARLVPWPLADAPTTLGAASSPLETSVIDCNEGFESALAGIRGVTRRMAAQALRRGVQIRLSDSSEASIDAYYAILRDASKGWGLERPPISASLLKAVVRRGGSDVEIWFADVDSEPIAGGVVLYGSNELFFWSAAMRRTHAQYRPSNALNLRLIQAACERGVRWYNLGASVGLAGVERFKTDLGARSISYAVYTSRSSKFHIYERVRSALRSAEVS